MNSICKVVIYKSKVLWLQISLINEFIDIFVFKVLLNQNISTQIHMIILDLLNKLAVINLIIDKVVIIAKGDICSYFQHFI